MKNTVILLALFSMIAIWAVLHQPAGFMTDYEIKFWDNKEPQADLINEQFRLDREPVLLYLDPGDAPYFFRAKSACRYVAPLPVQRDAPGWNLSGLEAYQEEYDCIMNYRGRYIVFDAGNHYDGVTDWFSETYSHRVPLMQKIHSEYRLVYNGSWRIYQRIPDVAEPLLPLSFNESGGHDDLIAAPHMVRLSFSGNESGPILNVRGEIEVPRVVHQIGCDATENVLGTCPVDSDLSFYSFSGNTSSGSIDVPMLAVSRYTIDISNASYGYYHRFWIYPRESEYVFRIP